MALSLSELKAPTNRKSPGKKRQSPSPAPSAPQPGRVESRLKKKAAQRPWRPTPVSELDFSSGSALPSQVWSFSLRHWLKTKYETSSLFYWPKPKTKSSKRP